MYLSGNGGVAAGHTWDSLVNLKKSHPPAHMRHGPAARETSTLDSAHSPVREVRAGEGAAPTGCHRLTPAQLQLLSSGWRKVYVKI